MMEDRVTVVAPFRECAGRVGPFRARLDALEHVRDRLRVVCVEGDSRDETRALLCEWAAEDSRVCVLACDTGAPLYGSVVSEARFAQLAHVFNTGLAAVDRQWSEYVMMLPSDIVYGPELLGNLLAHDVDVVAPLVFMNGRFYDVWAFSRDGRPLPSFTCSETGKIFDTEDTEGAEGTEIFLEGTAPSRKGTLVEMETVGGTLLMKAALLQAGVRYRAEDVDRGLCVLARALGYRVWADVGTWVVHPAR
jgi:hypothetical protein